MLGGLLVGGVLAAAPAWGPRLLPGDVAFGAAPLAGVLVSVPAFAGLCFFVRCRSCKGRLFWLAVAKRNHPGGIHWFLTARTCPLCGTQGS